MGEKLKLPPLFYTLAQIYFNPIEQMQSAYVPRIQEALRLLHYPDFKQDTVHSINIRKTDKPIPEIENSTQNRWRFTNTAGDEGYLLLNNSIVFQTTNYISFDDFSDKVIKGLNLVNDIIQLSYVERIGLRYLNVVQTERHDNIDKFVQSSLLGLTSIKNGEINQTFSEIQATINNGTLVSRTVTNKKGISLPPDIFPMLLKPLTKFEVFEGKSVTLDLDYVVAQRFDFNIETVREQLCSSHDIITDAFHESITEHALSVWR